jgi:nucleotide-binding universal stress UspA family protein
MFSKIVVPVDGSAFAEAAMPMALALSEKTGAEVRLAMVNEPVNLPPGLWAEAFVENHARYLESLIGSVSERVGADTTVSSVLLEGQVAESLCGETTACGADLIVMSTHGHGGLARVWLGSVADAVLRESPVPVLLVRPGEDDTGDPLGPDSLSHIVVPLDGNPLAEAALEPALGLARLFEASVTLLKTVTYPVMISSYLPDTVEDNEAFIRQAEEGAMAYLNAVKSRIVDGTTNIDVAVMVSQRPAAGVLHQVDEVAADFVAMASRNRHGLARAALGSIADKVIRGSKTPVLIVHPTDEARSERSEEVA